MASATTEGSTPLMLAITSTTSSTCDVEGAVLWCEALVCVCVCARARARVCVCVCVCVCRVEACA